MIQLKTDPASLTVRALGLGLLAGLAALLAIGIPTDVVPNPWFARMTPVRPLDYIFLGVTVLLAGILGATYALPAACSSQKTKITAGGVLSALAVGCPVCNKLVVLALGMSGAVTVFEPLQPALGFGALALLAVAVAARVRAVGAVTPGR